MEYKNILIIKMSSLGDILHTLPFAAALRERFGNAKITWLVQPEFSDFIPKPLVIDEIIFFDKAKFTKMSVSEKIKYFFQMRSLLRAQKFDLAIDMQGLFKSAVLAFLSGCKTRIGYCEMRELSSLVSKPIYGEHSKSHVIERYLDVARYLGAKTDKIEFPMADLGEATKSVQEKLLKNRVNSKYIVIAPAARWKTKEWPLEYYAELIKKIVKDGFFVVLAGAKNDKEKSDAIKFLVGAKKLIDLTGETTLKELAALIKSCAVYISADTGPLHFASALKKPLIAMYGPTLADRTGPYGSERASVILTPASCGGCLKKKCDDWHCMGDITPQMVYKVFKEKIGQLDD